MPAKPSEKTFLHHQPLDNRPTVVRAGLSRGWDDDFYQNRIAKESKPATLVLCGGFGIRCISGNWAATTWKSAIIRLAHDTHPQRGSMAGSWRRKLSQEPLAGTALRRFELRHGNTDTADRTYVLERGCGVCVVKRRYSDTLGPAQRPTPFFPRPESASAGLSQKRRCYSRELVKNVVTHYSIEQCAGCDDKSRDTRKRPIGCSGTVPRPKRMKICTKVGGFCPAVGTQTRIRPRCIAWTRPSRNNSKQNLPQTETAVTPWLRFLSAIFRSR